MKYSHRKNNNNDNSYNSHRHATLIEYKKEEKAQKMKTLIDKAQDEEILANKKAIDIINGNKKWDHINTT